MATSPIQPGALKATLPPSPDVASQFSLEKAAQCCFAIITAQLLLDLLLYGERYLLKTGNLGKGLTSIASLLYLSPIHGFAIGWWIALFPVCFWFGMRYRVLG